uniref:Uncharacterized protein n=1 Tax=Gossypium raimondii TaxID=29730 RepID=A0A0D2TW66_GOSRA|nr:hypothetical protein B456_013G064600 [Gossypium raimondii]
MFDHLGIFRLIIWVSIIRGFDSMAAVADNSGEAAVANGNNNLVVETSKSESKEFNVQKLVDMFTKLNPLAKEFFPSSYHHNPTKTGDFN